MVNEEGTSPDGLSIALTSLTLVFLSRKSRTGKRVGNVRENILHGEPRTAREPVGELRGPVLPRQGHRREAERDVPSSEVGNPVIRHVDGETDNTPVPRRPRHVLQPQENLRWLDASILCPKPTEELNLPQSRPGEPYDLRTRLPRDPKRVNDLLTRKPVGLVVQREDVDSSSSTPQSGEIREHEGSRERGVAVMENVHHRCLSHVGSVEVDRRVVLIQTRHLESRPPRTFGKAAYSAEQVDHPVGVLDVRGNEGREGVGFLVRHTPPHSGRSTL